MQRSHNFVQQASCQPLVVSYSSDGKPLHTKETCVASFGAMKKVRRQGGSGKGYIVQIAFLRVVDAPDKTQTTVIIKDRPPLTYGKGP
eukprot:6290077-Alexandrium_andersonii.AAC.1